MAVGTNSPKGAAELVGQVEEEEDIVDINDTSLADGTSQEIDTKEDWQARACPPPKGNYRLKLYIGDAPDEWTRNRKPNFAKEDPNGVFFTKVILCKIQDPSGAWDNSVVNYKASSGVPRGKKMSTMAGLMVLGKIKLPASMTDKQVSQMFYKFLAREPVLVASCDWSAWDTEDTSARNKFGIRLKEGMLNFPKLPEGKFQHILKGKKGNDVAATLKVVKWIGASAVSVPQSVQVAQGLKPATAPVGVIPKLAVKPVAPPVAKIVEAIEELEAVQGEFDLDMEGEVILEG